MKLENLSEVNPQQGMCGSKTVNVSDFCRPHKLKIFAINGHVSQHDLTKKGMDHLQKELIMQKTPT